MQQAAWDSAKQFPEHISSNAAMTAVQEKGSSQSPERQSLPEHLEHGDSSFVESIQREKALIRKIDWRLLPILGALYAVALVDRINVRFSAPPSPVEDSLVTWTDLRRADCWDGRGTGAVHWLPIFHCSSRLLYPIFYL